MAGGGGAGDETVELVRHGQQQDAVVPDVAAQAVVRQRAGERDVVGPAWLGVMLALIAWWHTRGPGQRRWR